MFLNLFWIVSLLLTNEFSQATVVSAGSDSLVTPDANASQVSRVTPDFEVSVREQAVPYHVMAVFALPDEELPLVISSADTGFRVQSDAGAPQALGSNQWRWRAPSSPGAYAIRIGHDHLDHEVRLNVFVMEPYGNMKRGYVGGYRIGSYPSPRARLSSGYARPRGFVQVTAETETMLVSPHFRLGQFMCKEGRGFPKYVVLRPELVLKLERLLETAHRNGVNASTFQFLSAYRTPLYNRGIGNKTTFSRHQYGDAADIFVDENSDGVMDDLDGNGRHDRRDAQVLRRWAEVIDRAPGVLAGGLSDYPSTGAHGSFVHVDARGQSARW